MAGATLCEIFATVPTGLEHYAADECREVLGREAKAHRGKISLGLACLEELEKVDALRSIDNYYVIVKELPEFCKDEPTVLQRLESLPFDGILDWKVGLATWQHYSSVVARETPPLSAMHSTSGNPTLSCPTEEQDCSVEEGSRVVLPDPASDVLTSNEEKQSSQPPPDSAVPSVVEEQPLSEATQSPSDVPLTNQQHLSFRVTCTRGGRKHCFSSMDAAKHFGAGVARYFNWKVQMKNPDIEVLLNIMGDSATVGIALTREGKFKRNITHFGPTTLRSTIAYGLLRCANIQPGDIVVDPMCGGGSISIEGALAWDNTFHLAGDIHELATPRTLANLQNVHAERQTLGKGEVKADVIRWDVCLLPLRTASVDVIVTDMPFGKKSGSKVANWELYPSVLQELSRVCRPSVARAVLLTHDIKGMSRVLQKNRLWKRVKTLWTNVGGLNVGVYLLQRTKMAYDSPDD